MSGGTTKRNCLRTNYPLTVHPAHFNFLARVTHSMFGIRKSVNV